MTIGPSADNQHLQQLANAVGAYGAIHVTIEVQTDGRSLLKVTDLNSPGPVIRIAVEDGSFVNEWTRDRFGPVDNHAIAAAAVAIALRGQSL